MTRTRCQVGGAAHRVVDDRPALGGEVKADAHAFERQQDIGEHDGRVELETPQRLQRDLGGHLGPTAHLDERELLADGAVLGQVAPRLAHDPYGCGVDGPAEAGFEESHTHLFGRRAVIVAKRGVMTPRPSTISRRLSARRSTRRSIPLAQGRPMARVANDDTAARRAR